MRLSHHERAGLLNKTAKEFGQIRVDAKNTSHVKLAMRTMVGTDAAMKVTGCRVVYNFNENEHRKISIKDSATQHLKLES